MSRIRNRYITPPYLNTTAIKPKGRKNLYTIRIDEDYIASTEPLTFTYDINRAMRFRTTEQEASAISAHIAAELQARRSSITRV